MSDDPELPQAWNALLALIACETDAARRRGGFIEAATRCGLRARWPSWGSLAPFEDLDEASRDLARAVERNPCGAGGFGIPGTRRLLRRWLGLEPPGVMERPLPGDDSRPLWQRWREAPEPSLEFNQGVPDFVCEALTPASLLEASAESVLEPYGIRGNPLEARLREVLERDAAEAASWAEGFARLLASIRRVDAPCARDDAQDYGMLGIYDWDTLGLLTLTPLVRAGRPIDPAWDHLVPFAGSRALVRPILASLPPERAEAVVYRRLMTDWGTGGEQCLNGFDSGLAVLDLAPSVRVTQVLSAKLKNNRRYFKKHIEKIRARLDALAAEHSGVAEGLKPRRRAATPRAPRG